MEKKTGVIKMTSKNGYGFIAAEDGTDIFFHFRGLLEPKDFIELKNGMPVEFMLSRHKDKTCAIGIKEIKKVG